MAQKWLRRFNKESVKQFLEMTKDENFRNKMIKVYNWQKMKDELNV
jgi:hypothetical protein